MPSCVGNATRMVCRSASSAAAAGSAQRHQKQPRDASSRSSHCFRFPFCPAFQNIEGRRFRHPNRPVQPPNVRYFAAGRAASSSSSSSSRFDYTTFCLKKSRIFSVFFTLYFVLQHMEFLPEFVSFLVPCRFVCCLPQKNVLPK